MKLALTALLLSLLAPLAPAHAEPWSLLRSKNANVEDGNQRLAANDPKGALAAYDKAARELPSEGGVHLNRGLALLRSGDLPKAREALHLATQPPASAEVRADAHYDLGIAFYKEADQRAGEQKHDEAQKLFREAADAFKQSLRKRPGDRNAAWNYELAARRVREQEEEQKKQEEQKKNDQQNQDQQNQDQQNQDQQNQDPQKQDQQNQDQQKQDQAKNDEKKQDPQQKPDPQKQDQQQQQQPQQAQQQQAQQQPPAPRPEVDRALDALQDGEENLERMRALDRAARERRKPEKDW
jgi:Ca-activated chloride channel family protein